MVENNSKIEEAQRKLVSKIYCVFVMFTLTLLVCFSLLIMIDHVFKECVIDYCLIITYMKNVTL